MRRWVWGWVVGLGLLAAGGEVFAAWIDRDLPDTHLPGGIFETRGGELIVGNRLSANGAFEYWAVSTSQAEPPRKILTHAAALSGAADLDAQTLFLVLNGALLRTLDGGANWTPLALPADAWAIEAQPPARLRVACADGVLRTSDDLGASWTEQTLPVPCRLLCVDAQGALYAASMGELFRSRDGGESWQTLLSFSDPEEVILSLRVWNGQLLMTHSNAMGANSAWLERSLDQGETWLPVLANAPSARYAITATGRIFVASMEFYEGDVRFRLVETSDFGATWQDFLPAEQTPQTPIALHATRNGRLFLTASGEPAGLPGLFEFDTLVPTGLAQLLIE